VENGKQYRFSLKTNDKKQANQLLKDYKKNLLNLPTKQIYEKKPNLYAKIDDFIVYAKKTYTLKTIGGVRFHLNSLKTISTVKHAISDLKMCAIFDLIFSQQSVYQQKLRRTYFSIFYAWLIRNEFCENNPITKIPKPKIPQKLPVWVTETQLYVIVDKIPIVIKDTFLMEVVCDITKVAFYSGMRLNEIATLTLKQIDFINNCIKLDNQSSITKSKKIRVIPISSKILDILKQRVATSVNGYVFYSNNFSKPNFDNVISQNFKKVIRSIPEIDQKTHFHSLRHGFCSALILRGISPVTVQKLAGHANIATTMIYTHVSNKQLTDAIDLL
jgi:site-specific recombinase XerD